VERNEPAETETEPASLERLDVLVEELAKAEEEERAAREVLRQAEVAWRASRNRAAEKREKRNRVMGQLRHVGVTPLAERVGVTHQQASRILAEGQ